MTSVVFYALLMSKLRRHFKPGDWVFLTSVTYERRPILYDLASDFLELLHAQCKRTGAEARAWVVLPDHVHIIIDSRETDVSALMRRIKLSFSARFRIRCGVDSGKVWQPRFYDHIIRNEGDLHRHLDYIHFNPVKHGHAESPGDWSWSSLGEYVSQGQYEPDWRAAEQDQSEYGE